MNRLPENFGHVNQQLKPGVIGAQVVMLTLDGTHFLPTVVKTMDRSPASFSGVSYGDVVLEIDGISTTNKKTIDIISLLRGEPDTNVSLKVWRGENKVKLITVKRKAFNLIY